MRIEFRFGLILAFCFTLGVAIAGYISYSLEFRQFRAEVTEKANVLLTAALAMRNYTASEIAPLVKALKDDGQFHPQMVPSYGAQSAMQRLHDAFPDYEYHERSLNPTNVADRASDWEVGLFRSFQGSPDLKELSGEVVEGGESRFYVARPLRLDKPECLECHSTPEAAPKAMIAHYGASNGFNWKLGDVIGIQVVQVPQKTAQNKALSSVLVTIGSLTSVFILTAALFMLLLRRYVTSPLDEITRVARSLSVDAQPAKVGQGPELEGQFRDLERSITRLKASLDQALRAVGGRAREGAGSGE
jgi:protein-histidine pros-kinase